ncbi:MAG TPA: hypothetical protein VGW77_23875 [Candidatus Binatia bacterium]|jgi:DNA-binding IclR family transcriptional regulator|nr:hypothetical protein [Candidatus Binatia bacterium]
MTREFIPDDIAEFIIEKIDSVAQLEALLLLRSSAEEKWSVRALSERLYINEKETADVLTHLQMHGFAIDKTGQPPLYQYQPASVELQQKVDRVAEIYSKHLLPVTNLIHSKPKTRVQEFADAFKFRKDD